MTFLNGGKSSKNANHAGSEVQSVKTDEKTGQNNKAMLQTILRLVTILAIDYAFFKLF